MRISGASHGRKRLCCRGLLKVSEACTRNNWHCVSTATRNPQGERGIDFDHGVHHGGLVHDVGRTCKRFMAARRRLPECLLLSPPRRQVPLQLDQGVMRTSPGGRQKDVKSSPMVADVSVLPHDIRVAQKPGRRQGPLAALSNALPTSLAAARFARPQLAGG